MTRECFYPDGIKPNSSDGDYVPCSSNDETPSACCKTGDGCSTSGLCHGSSGFMYRGACTDSTWTAPECAQQCRNGTTTTNYPCKISYTQKSLQNSSLISGGFHMIHSFADSKTSFRAQLQPPVPLSRLQRIVHPHFLLRCAGRQRRPSRRLLR